MKYIKWDYTQHTSTSSQIFSQGLSWNSWVHLNILYRCRMQEWNFRHHLKPPASIYCFANTANTATKIANRAITINFQALQDLISMQSVTSSKHSPRLPAACCATETIRTVLSALPDTSSVPVGLNFNVVGGKSWAFNIVKSH